MGGLFLDCMAAIAAMASVRIDGCHDVSSPLNTAWDLPRRWSASELRVLGDAGHGGGSMTSEIVGAVDDR